MVPGLRGKDKIYCAAMDFRVCVQVLRCGRFPISLELVSLGMIVRKWQPFLRCYGESRIKWACFGPRIKMSFAACAFGCHNDWGCCPEIFLLEDL